MAKIRPLAFLVISAAALSVGCGGGGGTSIPKALLGAHASTSSSSDGAISLSGSAADIIESHGNTEATLVVDETRFLSTRARASAPIALDRAVTDVASARAASGSARIVITDRESLNDLAVIGGEVSVESNGFMPDAGRENHVMVFVGLNRATSAIPTEMTLLPQAHVSVSRDESSGTETLTLSFGRVGDPTAGDDTPRLLGDATSIVILRLER